MLLACCPAPRSTTAMYGAIDAGHGQPSTRTSLMEPPCDWLVVHQQGKHAGHRTDERDQDPDPPPDRLRDIRQPRVVPLPEHAGLIEPFDGLGDLGDRL